MRIRRVRQAQAQRKKEAIVQLLEKHRLTEPEQADLDALLGRLRSPASRSAMGESGSAPIATARG
jgi:hypothetical protein